MKRASIQYLKPLLKSTLLHFAGLWAIFNLTTVVPYIYNSATNGYYLFYENGTPVTYGAYFMQQNLRTEMFLFLTGALLTELVYRFPFKKIKHHWLILLCIGIALFLLTPDILHRVKQGMYTDMLLYAGPVLCITAYLLLHFWIRDYFYQKVHFRQLQLQQSQSQLNALKTQLNPHFLFNSLNYLYGTALKENAEKTADGIDRLADLMRYCITSIEENLVPVENELLFVKNYISLQQDKLPATNNSRVIFQMEQPPTTLTIAPLLLLPFIENAFKYGISNEHPYQINIHISFADNRLLMRVNNTLIKNQVTAKGNNTGIKNTIKRLELQYPGNYKLGQTTNNNTWFISLSINLSQL